MLFLPLGVYTPVKNTKVTSKSFLGLVIIGTGLKVQDTGTVFMDVSCASSALGYTPSNEVTAKYLYHCNLPALQIMMAQPF